MAAKISTQRGQGLNHMTAYEVEQNLLLGVCIIIFAFVTIMVNSVAAYYLLVFKKTSKFNQKQYNNFLMGLQAITGIFLALTGYSWTAVAHLTGEWPVESLGCFIGTFCLLFFGTMTVMITLVMSAERFIAMCCPFYYQQLIDFRKISVAVGYTVVHSGVLASLPLLLNSVELTRQPIAMCLYSLTSHSFRETVVVHAFVCNFSLSIIVMLIMNVSVLKALKKMNRPIGVAIRAQFAGDRESVILSNLTGLMALSYSLCWLPIVVRNYIEQLWGGGKGKSLFLPGGFLGKISFFPIRSGIQAVAKCPRFATHELLIYLQVSLLQVSVEYFDTPAITDSINQSITPINYAPGGGH